MVVVGAGSTTPDSLDAPSVTPSVISGAFSGSATTSVLSVGAIVSLVTTRASGSDEQATAATSTPASANARRVMVAEGTARHRQRGGFCSPPSRLITNDARSCRPGHV